MYLNTIPNCLFQEYLRLRRGWRRGPRDFYKKVGIFKPDGLGDFVLALGAIRRIVENYGEDNCVLITCPLAGELPRREFPNVEHVTLPGTNARLWRHWSRLSHMPLFARGVERLVCLRHHRPFHQDVVIDAIPHENSIGAPTSLALRDSRDWAPRRHRFDFEITPPSSWGDRECYDLICHRLVVAAALDRAPDSVNVLPTLERLDTGPILPTAAVSPYGSHSTKDFPTRLLAEVARHIERIHGLSITLLSPHASDIRYSALAAELKKAGAHQVSVMQTPTFEDYLRAISQCRIVISVDTATAHLAVAMDRPLLALLGGGHYGYFAPWSRSRRQRWISHRTECYHCDWHCNQPEVRCLTGIRPETVLAAATDLLGTCTNDVADAVSTVPADSRFRTGTAAD